MIQAVLCDFDGVVRLWSDDGSARIETEFGLPAGAIGAAAFEPALLAEAVSGTITDEAWRQRIAEELAARHGEPARAAVLAWSELAGSLDEEMLDLLREVRRSAPVVLVTNATTRLSDDLAALGVSDSFDAVANSSQIGAAKPDAAIFERAAELVGARLADCVVIDDQERYLGAARSCGATVIRHETVAATRDALAALGIESLS